MKTKIPSSWNLAEDVLHSDCRIFEVRKQRFIRQSDQKIGDFFVLNSKDWVNVLALTKSWELVMVRQFRYGTKDFSLEPPGGVIEAEEDPCFAGERELREETGYAGKNAEIIGSISPNPAIMSNQCHFLLIKDVEKVSKVSFDPNEDLSTEIVPLSELESLVKTGKVSHSLALNAILHLSLKLSLGSLFCKSE